MREITKVVLCLVVLSGGIIWLPASAEESVQKAVLVTGASSGIGLSITEHLAAEGHFVYAGARKAEDIARLSVMDNVMGIRLDVTVQEEIDAAVELVEAGGRGLHGIINNAGVGVVGPLLEADEADLDFVFDVNVYGPYRVNKAFANLIIESKGRLSTISSISGVLSGPGFGVYSMSKHAMEAYTDSLAAEMALAEPGVHVSAIEPGNYKSRIGESMCRRIAESGQMEKETRWPMATESMRAMCSDDRVNNNPEPDAVAAAALHAMFDPNPKEHYLVVPAQRQADVTIRKAIEELVRFNEDHEFSYSRDELVQMLDEQLNPGDNEQ